MATRIRRRIGIAATVAALVALSAAALFIPRKPQTLEIRGADNGKVYARWAAEDGMEFAIEFVHSVNQSPVREFFTVSGREIRPAAVRFSSFGAGMQTELAEGQTLSRDEQGNMLITGFSQSHKQLNYIVGTVSDHIFFINGEELSLRELCGKNAPIILRVR